jgi:uncharacterized Fe-S cluster protein YjdI
MKYMKINLKKLTSFLLFLVVFNSQLCCESETCIKG